MKEQHFNEEISAFVNHELDPAFRQVIGEHLLACGHCRELHEKVKFAAKLSGTATGADAPNEVWTRIAAETERSRPRSSRYIVPKVAFAALAVIVACTGAWFLLRSETASVPVADISGWKIEMLSGDLSLGNRSTLAPGQSLETGIDDRARIQVADIGNVEIAPNSRVRLVESRNDLHRLALERGRLSARILAPPRLFIVDTPSAVAVDLGCAYTLEVEDNGDSRLHVTSGYVALERNDHDVIVPAGAVAVSKKGIGIGTPFAENASEEYRSTLYKIDFENGDQASLKRLVAVSGKSDSVTLFHLIRTVPASDRGMVLARLTKFVKLPQGTTAAGLIALDQKMLDDLWEQISVAGIGGF